MSKVKHSYSGRITAILHEGGELITKVGYVNGHQNIEDTIRSLDTAKAHAERVQEEFKALDKRGNRILKLAMETCGVSGRWKLSFEQRHKQISTMMGKGSLRFSLSVPASSKWKSRFRECPLFRVMPLEMPIDWLDMTTPQLRKEIAKRLQ